MLTERDIDLGAAHCPLCDAVSPRIRYAFEDCVILRCRDCALMWLHPKPDPESFHEIYDSSYFANTEFLQADRASLYGYVDYMAERINKQYEYKKVAREVTRDRARSECAGSASDTPSWLDVGCGLGYLLDVAFDEGYRVHGLEFNPSAVEYIRSKYTFPVTHGGVDAIGDDSLYDVITMFDVIEHLSEPMADLRRLRAVARPDAVLAVLTMDCDSFVSRLLGKHLEDIRRTREHLYFFSRRTLTEVLARCGWQVYRIRSYGHTFQVGALIDRLAVYSRRLSRVARACTYPRWLLEANFYLDPGTKIVAFARPAPAATSGGAPSKSHVDGGREDTGHE